MVVDNITWGNASSLQRLDPRFSWRTNATALKLKVPLKVVNWKELLNIYCRISPLPHFDNCLLETHVYDVQIFSCVHSDYRNTKPDYGGHASPPPTHTYSLFSYSNPKAMTSFKYLPRPFFSTRDKAYPNQNQKFADCGHQPSTRPISQRLSYSSTHHCDVLCVPIPRAAARETSSQDFHKGTPWSRCQSAQNRERTVQLQASLPRTVWEQIHCDPCCLEVLPPRLPTALTTNRENRGRGKLSQQLFHVAGERS